MSACPVCGAEASREHACIKPIAWAGLPPREFVDQHITRLVREERARTIEECAKVLDTMRHASGTAILVDMALESAAIKIRKLGEKRP